MSFQPIGYEFAPKARRKADFQDYVTTGGWAGGNPVMFPPPAVPVYADEKGGRFMALPTDEGAMAVPFIPGSPAEFVGGAIGEKGGFVPLEKMPRGGGGGGVDDMLKGMAQGLPAQMASGWLGKAAANAMLGGAPGGMLDSVMGSLGMQNPLASGAMGAAMKSALGAAGLGPAGSMLGGLMSGGGLGGAASSLGRMGVNNLLASSGLSNIPGMGALGNMAGGQLGGALADIMNTGGWAGPLEGAAGAIGGCFPGSGSGAGAMEDIMGGGCFPGGSGPDLNSVAAGIGADALNDAAEQMLSQWEVDDESSAAEHIAHKAVNDNKDKIKEAVSDPSGFSEKIAKFFSGEAPGAGLPAARITDPDVTKPEIISKGVGNILFGGLPVARMTDTISPSMALILEGAATVLSAELPTARLTSATDAPGIMIENGETTILVGGASASLSPPASAGPPSTPGNGGPAAPDAPDSGGSGSSGNADGDDGASESSDAGDSTTGQESAPGDQSPESSPGDSNSPDDASSEQPSTTDEPESSGPTDGDAQPSESDDTGKPEGDVGVDSEDSGAPQGDEQTKGASETGADDTGKPQGKGGVDTDDGGEPQGGEQAKGDPGEGSPGEGKHEKGKHEKGKHEKGKHEEGKHEEGKHEEGKHEEGKHEEGKHEEGKHGHSEDHKGHSKVPPAIHGASDGLKEDGHLAKQKAMADHQKAVNAHEAKKAGMKGQLDQAKTDLASKQARHQALVAEADAASFKTPNRQEFLEGQVAHQNADKYKAQQVNPAANKVGALDDALKNLDPPPKPPATGQLRQTLGKYGGRAVVGYEAVKGGAKAVQQLSEGDRLGAAHTVADTGGYISSGIAGAEIGLAGCVWMNAGGPLGTVGNVLCGAGGAIAGVWAYEKTRDAAVAAVESQAPALPRKNSPTKEACFPAETMVWGGSGQVPIHAIDQGQQLQTWDEQKYAMVINSVQKLDIHQGRFELMEIELSNGESIRVTNSHPFFTGSRWISSEQLRLGFPLVTLSGDPVYVKAIRENIGSTDTVFNVRCQPRTYAVGEAGVVVFGGSDEFNEPAATRSSR